MLFVGIALVANLVFTGINAYLYFSFNKELQVFSPTSTHISYAKAEDVNLGRPIQYTLTNEGKVEYTVHIGSTYATIWVITPHYGILSIRIKSFDISDSEYLNPEKHNSTKISFSTEDEDAIYIPLKPIENYLRADIYLKAYVYPNTEKNLLKGESIKILLGYLYLEAEAFDFETQHTETRGFSMKVFVEMEGT